jgi:uncharacterized membrane protein YgcG
MRKSTLFISAILTTFMMAVLVGLVSNFQNKNKEEAAAQTEEPVAAVEELPTATALPAATQAAFITPEMAAALASQVLGRTDLLSVETSVFNGEQAYLVKFIPGDQVYVSPTGQILSIAMVPAPTTTPAAVASSGGSSSGNNGGGDKGGFGGGGGGDDDGGGGGDDD